MQAITPAHRFDVPAKHGLVDENGGGTLGQLGDSYEWPRSGSLDVRRALGPDAACFALHYLTELEDGWVAATDTEARRGFGMCFDKRAVPGRLAVARLRGLARLLPRDRRALDGLPEPAADAVAAGRARVLNAGEVLETEVSAVLYGGVQSVSRLQADGSVEA